MASLKSLIKSPKSLVFRRASVKRRVQATGLFESTFQDISDDVIKWGKVETSVDPSRVGIFRFPNVRLLLDNSNGRYNPNTDEASLWFGFMDQQRSIVKIEAGFISQTTSGGIITRTEFPTSSSQIFQGIIQGDVLLNDKETISLNIKPLSQVFRDYPARNLEGYDSSMTASKFMTLLRDHTDGAGNFVFRPFFGDTTTNWNINSTTNIYPELSATAQDVIDKNCWEVIEKLAEAENHIAYISKDAMFQFQPRDATTTVAFEFYGTNIFNSEFGQTIKQVKSFGKKISQYYSRVQVKFRQEDTSTSFVVQETSLTVSSVNDPWSFGHRTFQFENIWISNTTTAETIASTLFTELSVARNEIEFTTSFVPHLEILDRVRIFYDSKRNTETNQRWDINNWDTELVWYDRGVSNSIILAGEQFKFLKMSIDLDNLQCSFTGRETS